MTKGRFAETQKVYGPEAMKLKLSHLALAAIMSLGVGASVSGAPLPNLLDTLERGLWQFRTPGGGPSSAGVTQVCLGDPIKLTQIRHGDAACTRFVVKSTPDVITVSYSCKGLGQGLTTIRKESGKIIHIQSQGIQNSSPFSFSVEGRRSGTC